MSPERKRTRIVRVKLSRVELFDMKRKAKDCGMPLATWLRVTGLANARGPDMLKQFPRGCQWPLPPRSSQLPAWHCGGAGCSTIHSAEKPCAGSPAWRPK